jgi:hypothetical protein
VNTDDGNTDYGYYGQYSITEIKRAGKKKGKKGKQHYPLRPGAEDGHILGIAFLKGSTG